MPPKKPLNEASTTEVTVNNRPLLFNEKATYLPLVMVIGIMASLSVGVWQASRYVTTQEQTKVEANSRFIDIKTTLAAITVRQDALQKDISEIRTDIGGFRSNNWSMTDMLVWCRETENMNKNFRCPASLRAPKADVR